jgi:hypothetical protein
VAVTLGHISKHKVAAYYCCDWCVEVKMADCLIFVTRCDGDTVTLFGILPSGDLIPFFLLLQKLQKWHI